MRRQKFTTIAVISLVACAGLVIIELRGMARIGAYAFTPTSNGQVWLISSIVGSRLWVAEYAFSNNPRAKPLCSGRSRFSPR